MARPRITRAQNMGQNRNTQMRNNSRVQQNRGTFQGGLARNVGISPQPPAQGAAQGMQQCPPGQEPGIDQNTGARTCIPSRPNISGNVPVNNKNRAMTPKPGTKPKGY